MVALPVFGEHVADLLQALGVASSTIPSSIPDPGAEPAATADSPG
jgi:hypothetical protein